MAASEDTPLRDLMEEQHKEPGVAQAMRAFEAIERAYFEAVNASPRVVAATPYRTSTGPQ